MSYSEESEKLFELYIGIRAKHVIGPHSSAAPRGPRLFARHHAIVVSGVYTLNREEAQ